MAAFSFQRATAALPSFLRRKGADETPRPPLRAVTDLGAPWAAAKAKAASPAPARPMPARTPARQESIVELLRRLEQGLSERAEAAAAAPDVEIDESRPHGDVDSALRTALETLQRMARQQR